MLLRTPDPLSAFPGRGLATRLGFQGVWHAWLARGVACKGCDMQRVWHAKGVTCKGCDMQRVWHAKGVACKGCGMQRVWHARGVACKGHGLQWVWDCITWFCNGRDCINIVVAPSPRSIYNYQLKVWEGYTDIVRVDYHHWISCWLANCRLIVQDEGWGSPSCL